MDKIVVFRPLAESALRKILEIEFPVQQLSNLIATDQVESGA